ncbi:unnamed protein product, partial [Brassica rapa]
EDGADCSSSQPSETMRPEGVKAAKARGKKTVVEENAQKENAAKEFQSMVSLKQQDLVLKDRLSKNMLLDSLISNSKGPERIRELKIDSLPTPKTTIRHETSFITSP